MQENRQLYKIYSRSRLNIFKNKNHKYYDPKGPKKEKIIFLIVIIVIAIFTANMLYKSVDPIFRTLCEDKAHEIATIVTNEEATKVMAKYKYGDMFTVEKDTNRKYKNGIGKYNYRK